MVGVGYHDTRYVPDDCSWSRWYVPCEWERHRVRMGEECQDGLREDVSDGESLYHQTPHLGNVNPVPAVHLEVGILPLLERNPRWSCAASLEGRFASWDSPNPEREMIPWFYRRIGSVWMIR